MIGDVVWIIERGVLHGEDVEILAVLTDEDRARNLVIELNVLDSGSIFRYWTTPHAVDPIITARSLL